MAVEADLSADRKKRIVVQISAGVPEKVAVSVGSPSVAAALPGASRKLELTSPLASRPLPQFAIARRG